MNKSNLLEILNNNKEIDKADAHWLQEVINFYPYFAAASFALTKYYQQNQDFQFQQQLKTTATLTSDRKSLYNFINVSSSNNINAEVLTSNLPKHEINLVIDAKPTEFETSENIKKVETIKTIEPEIKTEIILDEIVQEVEAEADVINHIIQPDIAIIEEKINEESETIFEEDIVIAISQSGETADTLAAIELAKSIGATIIGIFNVAVANIAATKKTLSN
jgi:hypothetical protein